MATAMEPKTTLTMTTDEVSKKPSEACEPVKIDIIRLPTNDDELEDMNPTTPDSSRTVLHIYFEHPCQHKLITPVLSPSQERRFGPTPKEQKARGIAKKTERKLREATQPPFSPSPPSRDHVAPEAQKEGEGSYFLHAPYLSFHLPPSVLYTCPSSPSRHAPSRPVALIHTGSFWRRYKIQLGPSLSQPGVIDPRGVVSWRHNGGATKALHADDRKLKGYRVRGWRLWGETGKAYVHWVRELRRAGAGSEDPDAEPRAVGAEKRVAVVADEVVYLTWSRPLSMQTRLYAFTFRGVEFRWKGTGTVGEVRKCGWMLRFCHLKLIARVPVDSKREEGTREVCLGKYTSSIAAEKSGMLEVYDHAVLRFVQEWMPSLLSEKEHSGEKEDDESEGHEGMVARLKKSILYQLIVATVLCMVNAEKEKRHTLLDLIIGILENAGNGGG